MTTPESEWHEVGWKGFDFASTDNHEDVFTGRPSALVSEELEDDVMTHNIILATFCVIGICANLLIIYIILYFKNMRTIPYIYLLNWSFCDVGKLIVSMVYVLYILNNSIDLNTALCFNTVMSVLRSTTIVFVMATTIDWFVAVYFKSSSEQFRKYHKYVIAAIWILAIILICTNIGLCMTDNIDTSVVIVSVMLNRSLYPTLGLIFVIQVIRAFQKFKNRLPEDSAVMLTLATFFIAVCLVLEWYTTRTLFILRVILGCVALCRSVFNVGLLYWLDKDFKMTFLKIVKNSKTTVHETPEVDKTTDTNEDEYSASIL